MLRTERLLITLGIVYLDRDSVRAEDGDYVDDVYHDIERRIQAGVDKLATDRRLPISPN